MSPRAWKWLTWAVALLVIGCAVWIMASQLGLSPDYDFGAGAYYYADIPSFERYSIYSTEYGYMLWLCIALFLVWGWLMFRLWKLVDNS